MFTLSCTEWKRFCTRWSCAVEPLIKYLLRPPTATCRQEGCGPRDLNVRTLPMHTAVRRTIPPLGIAVFRGATLDVCAHSSKGRRRLSRYRRTAPSAHLARDGDLIVMLVPVRRQVTVRVVKHKSHTRTADASLTLLIDELVEVARSHLRERRVGRVRR